MSELSRGDFLKVSILGGLTALSLKYYKWLNRFETRYQSFINQKTYQLDHQQKIIWWYTHKNLRRVYRTIKHNLNKYFHYLD